jgi:hypothetical protein
LESRHFLIHLARSPEVARLAEGYFDTEFLLAALCHFAVIHWGQGGTIFNNAMLIWDRLQSEYPILAGLLMRQLHGEETSLEVAQDIEEIRRDYHGLLNDITNRLAKSNYSHLRLAALIHMWFVHEYFQGWLQQLQQKQLSESQLKDLSGEVAILQQLDDLVEHCPHQRRPPVSDGMMSPIFGNVKDAMNNRLFAILDLYQKAIQMHRKVIVLKRGQTVSGDTLSNELLDLYRMSNSNSWTIECLLQPGLPLLRKLVPDKMS